MKTKKILAVVLSILTVVSCVSSLAISANAQTVTQNVTWEAGRYNADTGSKEMESSGYCIRTNDYIDLSNIKSLSINYSGNYAWNIHFYDNSKKFLSSSHGQFAYANTPGTVKVNGNYATVSVYKNPVTVSEGSNITINAEKSTSSRDETLTTTWEYGQLNRTAASLGLEQGSNQQFIRTDFIDVSTMSKVTISDTHSYRAYFYKTNNPSEIAIQETNSKTNTNSFDVPLEAKFMRLHFYESAKFSSLSYGDSISIKGYIQVSATNIDTSKKGSLTIYDYNIPQDANLNIQGTGEEADNSEYLQQIGATPIEGITFKLKRVVNESFRYNNESYYTEDGISLPDVTKVKSLNYPVYNTYTLSPTDKDGKTTINNLPLGIYLVQEDGETGSDTAKVQDFLVSVPSTNSTQDGWNYDITVYPKTKNGVTLTYDPNNSLSSDNPFSELRRAGKTEPLTENKFTVPGMFFLGWGENPTDKVPKYLDKDDFKMPEQDTTLYAIWGYTNQFRYYTQFKYSEPWGLRLSFALLNPKTSKVIDCSKYDDYGMYIYPTHEPKTQKINLSWEQGGISGASATSGAGNSYNSDNAILHKEFIDVSNYSSITVKYTGTQIPFIHFYDSNKNIIETDRDTTNNPFTVNVPKNAKYMRTHIWKSGGIEPSYGNNVTMYGDRTSTIPSLQEVVTKGKKADKYEPKALTFNDGSTDNYLTTIYDDNIYTQNLDEDIYTVCYVTYKGRTFWGTVKNRCVEDSVVSIINTSQVGLTTYTEAEVKLATAIKAMYDAEIAYYIQGSNVTTYPDGKKMVDNKKFNLDWESGGINGNGTPYEQAQCIRVNDFIDVSKYSTLQTSFNNEKNNPYSYSVFTYDKDKKFISRLNFNRNSNSYTYAINDETFDINCAYVKFHIYTNKSNYSFTDEDYNRLSINGINKNYEKTVTTEWEQGYLSGVTGATGNNTTDIRTGFMDVSNFTTITYNGERVTNRFFWYDKDKNFISATSNSTVANRTVPIPSNTAYAKMSMYNKDGLEPSYGDGIELTLKKFTEGETKTFSHLTSLRAIEPWEMKLQAVPTEADYESYDDYGVITYTDYYNTFDKDKTLTYADLINNENCMVFSHNDDMCYTENVSGNDFITATSENIYTYRLQQTNVYTCFYYIKNGVCYYSDVKKRNGLDMANKVVQNKETGNIVSELAADVATQMINLYRETYYYRNGKYPTDDYDGPVWYKEDYNTPTHATIATDAKP